MVAVAVCDREEKTFSPMALLISINSIGKGAFIVTMPVLGLGKMEIRSFEVEATACIPVEKQRVVSFPLLAVTGMKL